jgi:hypothetical protein
MPSPQRIPAKEKTISSIAADDGRVSVVGTVVDSNGGIVVMDDGSGKVEVSFDEPMDASSGQFVRTIGRVIPSEGGFQLQGEVLQDFSGADIEMWRKVSVLWDDSMKQL